jgi:hypothetical protein
VTDVSVAINLQADFTPHVTTKQINFATWFATTRGVMLATAILTTALFLPAVYRAYPFVDDVNPTISAGNDWLSYKENALSILRDGLSMPSVTGNYSRPGGFLYNYFVAAIFALTGVNSKHVYLVQTLLLGFSVGLMTLAFKPYLTNRISSIYFVTLAGLFFLEVFCIYTFRLLSENLVIFLLALFCLLALRAFEAESILLAACAGVAAGLCALCRPNLILLAPATAALVFLYKRGRPHRLLMTLVMLATFCLTFALLPLRNYALTKKASFSVITYTNDWAKPEINLAAPVTLMKIGKALVTSIDFYGRRILFCVGLTFFELPIYWLRPHWTIIWAGALLFLWRAVKGRRLEFWEAFAITFIVMYLGPLIAVAQISNYGVRMIVPVLPMLLLLAIVGVAPKLEGSGHGKRMI